MFLIFLGLASTLLTPDSLLFCLQIVYWILHSCLCFDSCANGWTMSNPENPWKILKKNMLASWTSTFPCEILNFFGVWPPVSTGTDTSCARSQAAARRCRISWSSAMWIWCLMFFYWRLSIRGLFINKSDGYLYLSILIINHHLSILIISIY